MRSDLEYMMVVAQAYQDPMKYQLPYKHKEGRIRLEPGTINRFNAGNILTMIARAQRIAPWINVVCAPQVLVPADPANVQFGGTRIMDDDQREWQPVMAVYFSDPKDHTLVYSTQCEPRFLIMEFFRCLWVAVDSHEWLNRDWIGQIQFALDNDAPDALHHLRFTPLEQRSTAFGAYALAVTCGLKYPMGFETTYAEIAYDETYDGKTGDFLTRLGTMKPTSMIDPGADDQ